MSAFASCSGSASAQQSFTVGGSNLTNNIVISAPIGFEVSTTSGSSFTTSVTLTQSGGTVNSTTIYIRLTSSATGSPSGNISITSNGAIAQNIVASGTVNALPTIALGSNPSICNGITSASLTYSSSTGSPDQYNISWEAGATVTGFIDVSNTSLLASPIALSVPSNPGAGTYIGTLSVVNSTTGCSSAGSSISVAVNAAPSSPSVTSASYCIGTNASELSATASANNLLKWYGTNATGGTSSLIAPTPSTPTVGTINYYVSQITTATGCESPRTILRVSVNNIPTAPILSRDVNDYLVSNTTSNIWYKDGVILSDTTQKIKPKIGGVYTVKTTQNGCSSLMSSSYYYLITDIANLGNGQFIKFAPNPFYDKLNFDFYINGYQKMYLNVFDFTTGKLVGQNKDVYPGCTLQFGNLMPGKYLFKLYSYDGKMSFQFKILKL